MTRHDTTEENTIITKQLDGGDMTADLLNDIIHRWRMSNQFLAKYLRRSIETVKSYRYNRLAIPQEIADKMRRLHVFLAMED